MLRLPERNALVVGGAPTLQPRRAAHCRRQKGRGYFPAYLDCAGDHACDRAAPYTGMFGLFLKCSRLLTRHIIGRAALPGYGRRRRQASAAANPRLFLIEQTPPRLMGGGSEPPGAAPPVAWPTPFTQAVTWSE